MKKFAIAMVALIAIITAGTIPAIAAGPLDNKGKEEGIEPVVGNKVALSTHAEATYQGKNARGEHIYKARIDSLPIYTEDLSTKIDPSWHYDKGKEQWIAGPNLFSATVDAIGTGVTITKGKEWLRLNSDIRVGGKVVKPISQVPRIVPDYYNDNYTNNTLEWDYGRFKRQIRIIEGCIFQYLIFDEDPGATVNVGSVEKSLGFTWDKDNEAWDAKGNIVLVHDNLIYADDLAKASYPVVIDPSSSFTTSSSDGWLYHDDSTWSNTRTAGTANFKYTTTTYLSIQANVEPDDSGWIRRSYVYFDTSSIADATTLTDAELYMYKYDIQSNDWNGKVYIVEGMPTYPHDPLQDSDYNYSYYDSFSTTYGYRYFSQFDNSDYTIVNYSGNASDLKDIVNKSGTTKLCLIENADTEASWPYSGGDDNYIRLYSYEKGSGYQPYIEVTYSTTAPSITAESASDISYTSARLNSEVDDDGGEACDVRFGYGQASQNAVDFDDYTNITDWVEDTYNTGDHPYYDASSLDANTTYYFRAQIRNSDSTFTSANEITFDTLNDILDVDDLRAYPSASSTITLGWTRPSGATNTLIKYALDDYPATTADGEELYLDSGNNYEHTGVTGGVTYYYSAWGESGGDYSTNPDNTAVTAQLASTVSGDLEEAGQPAGWYQSPDYTNMSNLFFVYEGVNNLADDVSMPRPTAWLGLMISIAVGAGFLLYWRTHNIFASVGGSCFILVAGFFSGLIPLWMMIITVIAGVGIMITRRQAG